MTPRLDLAAIRLLATTVAKKQRGTTKRGRWRWLDGNSKPLKKGKTPQQSSYLGETLISLGDTYEGSDKDCAYVEHVVNEAPELAAALLLAAREIEELRAQIAGDGPA